jgi:hypothetical protein
VVYEVEQRPPPPHRNSFSNTLPGSVSSASKWREPYERAILELDNTKLPGRIVKARHAILDRAEETLTRPSCDEHRALNAALRALRLLEGGYQGKPSSPSASLPASPARRDG